MANENQKQSNRRKVLAIWLNLMGGLSQASIDKQFSKSIKRRISRLLRGDSFGRIAARNLEHNLGMPPHFLESVPKVFENMHHKLDRYDLRTVANNRDSDLDSFSDGIDQRDSMDEPSVFNVANYPFPHSAAPLQQRPHPRGISPLQVSPQWLAKNITNFDCIKDFCIVTDYSKKLNAR